jgi:hypothetical protein
VGSAILWFFHSILEHLMTATPSDLDQKLARLFDILGASTVRRYGLGVPAQQAPQTKLGSAPTA